MADRKSELIAFLEITIFFLIGGGLTGYWEARSTAYIYLLGIGLILGLTRIIISIKQGIFREGVKKAGLLFVAAIFAIIFFKIVQMLAVSLAEGSNNQIGSDIWFNLISTLIGAAVGSGLAVWGALYTQKKANQEAENHIVRENAIIVYFDLYLGLNDLKKLYIGCKSNDNSNTPIRLYFSNEWIKNVAMLEKYIRDHVSEIYLLYGELLTIADLLGSNMSAKDAVIRLGDKVFNREHFIEPISEISQPYEKAKWSNIKKADLDINNILNDDYRIILEKLNELRTMGI